MTQDRIKFLTELYHEVFFTSPEDYFSSSGRIELLGNHTDHNHGLVLVGAVDLDIVAASGKCDENTVTIHSYGYPPFTIDLSDLSKKEEEIGRSQGIVRGVLARMKDLGYQIGGFRCVMNSTVYSGAGVSSSAAFECLIATIENHYYNQGMLPAIEIAKISQYAEREYFNKPCGLLDQCGVAFGGVNKINFSDVENPVVENVTVELDPYKIVLINTGGSHSKLTEQYAAITNEMRQVANYFQKDYLIEVSEREFIGHISALRKQVSDRAILRAMHFYNENKIVNRGFRALMNHDILTFLKCVNESGRNSFEELQNIQNAQSEKQNIALAIGLTRTLIRRGAVRVHGGGFEGTILAFVHQDDLDRYVRVMSAIFKSDNVHCVQIRNVGPYRLSQENH